MLVTEFLQGIDDAPLSADAAPGHYLGLFMTMLDEFQDEKCSVLFGKIKAALTPELKANLLHDLSDCSEGVREAGED